MDKVQKDLYFLKRKANEQELKMRKDERINALENSLEWLEGGAKARPGLRAAEEGDW